MYPLSAVHSAEGSGSSENKGNRVSWAFFWQTPGAIIPYLVAILLAVCMKPEPPDTWVPQWQFRILFALGLLPSLAVFVTSLKEEESTEFHETVQQRANLGAFEALRREPKETMRTLFGTAGTWFCYDVAYYGTAVFTPSILESICMVGTRTGDKCSQTLLQTSVQAAIVGSAGLPGTIMAIVLIKKLGSKRLNVWGNVLLFLNFGAMGGAYAISASSTVKFILLCTLTFLLNFGPNLGTFVLPAICFPAHVRSTCHGISAFGGKLGALSGTLMFPIVKSSSLGMSGVLYIQAGLCLAGALISQLCLRHDWQYLPEADRVAVESFVDASYT